MDQEGTGGTVVKAKQAKRILKERDSLASQLAEAEALVAQAEEARAEAERLRDEAAAERSSAQEAVEHARRALDASLLVLAEAGNRLIDCAHLASEAHATVEKAGAGKARVLRALDRPRFREAEEKIEKAREAQAAQEIQAKKVKALETKLSPEAIESLKFLKRVYRPENIRGSSRVFVPSEGGRERDLDEEEVLYPCEDCGAKPGQPCDEGKHAELERRGRK
jgi:chromosome segregation ATPase